MGIFIWKIIKYINIIDDYWKVLWNICDFKIVLFFVFVCELIFNIVLLDKRVSC